MKQIKTILTFFLIFFLSITECFENSFSKQEVIKDPFCVLTVHKSGTNLILKLLKLVDQELYSKKISNKNAGKFRHFCPDLESEYFSVNLDERKILGIRDLRDTLVSHVYFWDRRISENGFGPAFNQQYIQFYKDWTKLTFDEKLNSLMTGNIPKNSKAYQSLNNRPLPKPMNLFVRDINEFKKYYHSKNSLLCKFEDLIGARGDGDKNLQIKTVEGVLKFLDISLEKTSINNIAENLFGGTWTFRKGKIGEWKTHFSKKNKEVFKKTYGDIIIDLGYEKDYNW